MEQRRNEMGGLKREIAEKTRRPAASSGTDSHLRKFGSDPAGNRTPVHPGERRQLSFLHWLLTKRDATPLLTELHVIRAHNWEVFIYWRRTTQGVSSQVWSNGKPTAKIDVKHVYTEVNFAIGSQFIIHALDDSEPVGDLQRNKWRVPYCQGYYAVVRRQQCSPIGLTRPEPRPQSCRTSLGRIGSPGEGSSVAAKIHCSTYGMVARGMATNPRGYVLHTLVESMPDRMAAVIAARDITDRYTTADELRNRAAGRGERWKSSAGAPAILIVSEQTDLGRRTALSAPGIEHARQGGRKRTASAMTEGWSWWRGEPMRKPTKQETITSGRMGRDHPADHTLDKSHPSFPTKPPLVLFHEMLSGEATYSIRSLPFLKQILSFRFIILCRAKCHRNRIVYVFHRKFIFDQLERSEAHGPVIFAVSNWFVNRGISYSRFLSIGYQLVRHAQEKFEPVAELQENKDRIPYFLLQGLHLGSIQEYMNTAIPRPNCFSRKDSCSSYNSSLLLQLVSLLKLLAACMWEKTSTNRLGHQKTLAQSSPPTVAADNQCTVDISISVHKTVESSLQGRTSKENGAAVAERLDCSLPNNANGVQSPAGSLRISAGGNRAVRCRRSAGFLRGLPFPPPLHPYAAPYLPHFTHVGSQAR
ncbi:hypothetical protein PR048_031135 [Dryococelus australis]|uniref:Uncharacterized protein n=1 Tax=Dryococelus australis TaxID=614101 RepID=A0ABQ9G4E0_9NEOP|nr:hypothetical protein PR048_031135 [Dryococelus australis]